MREQWCLLFPTWRGNAVSGDTYQKNDNDKFRKMLLVTQLYMRYLHKFI